MKVLYCWQTFEGYFGACWRALAARPGMDVSIIARRSDAEGIAPHGEEVLRGLDMELHAQEALSDSSFWVDRILAHAPDVLVLPGWVNPACVRGVMDARVRDIPLVMAMDRPWEGTLRQRLGRWRYRRYFAPVDHVVAAGERAERFALRLGFRPECVSRGMYGIDTGMFAACAEGRGKGEWPRSFVFVGRYVPEKGADVLARAYREYRASTSKAWALRCCGRGPLVDVLRDAGAEDLGFVQPESLPGVLGGAGAFILPSVFEPWGVALVEAAAAGLPLICTKAVGAGDEVAGVGNALVVAPGNASALAGAMRWMHERVEDLPGMGARSRTLSAAHDAGRWAERWAAALENARRHGTKRAGVSGS